MRKGTPRPTSKDKRQIVQIAAILYDNSSGEELASFDALVKPINEQRVGSFFEELTGITQARISREGRPFMIVFKEFVEFCADYEVWTFHKDEEVFRQNCGYIDEEWPFRTPFIQVRQLLTDWGVEANHYSSGTLYQAAGIIMDGHVHNALHDVRSMAAAVHVLERQ